MVDFIFSPLYNVERRRGVAQLVEHYLREVGAARSNRVTPIKKVRSYADFFIYSILLKLLKNENFND